MEDSHARVIESSCWQVVVPMVGMVLVCEDELIAESSVSLCAKSSTPWKRSEEVVANASMETGEKRIVAAPYGVTSARNESYTQITVSHITTRWLLRLSVRLLQQGGRDMLVENVP